MRAYIKNLTDNFIGKHHLEEEREFYPNRSDFLKHIAFTLEICELQNMRPETLGKILGEFEVCDVMASQAEIVEQLHFSGDCMDLLRRLVATTLAHAIFHRLSEVRMPGVPGYRTTKRVRSVSLGRDQ